MVTIDARTRMVMEQLIEKPVNDSRYLMNQLSSSKSQIDYSLDKINTLLLHFKQKRIVYDYPQIEISEENKQFFLHFISGPDSFSYYYLNEKERKKVIIFMLLHHCNRYLSINHFLHLLNVGKTTFLKDIRQVDNELHKYCLRIHYTRKDGYQLEGEEAAIRSYLMRMVIEDTNSSGALFLYHYFFYKETIAYRSFFDQINRLIERYHIKLVENRSKEFGYTLLFLLPRLMNDWHPFFVKYNDQNLFKMKEYSFAKELLLSFGIDNQHSFLYICGWVLGIAIGNADEELPDYSIIHELVGRIFTRFELLSGVSFKNRVVAEKQLFSHLRPAYYRIFFQLPIVNVLHEKIMKEYADLYDIVKETMRPIAILFDKRIPDEELSFLTIHFASLLDDYDEYIIHQKVGLIVCPNGIGSSAMIYNELKSIFPEMIFLGPIETEALSSIKQSYDMVFTTIPNIRLYIQKKPVYVVNPIMTIEEKYHLLHKVHHADEHPLTFPKLHDLMQIISDYAVIKDKNRLENELARSLRNYTIGKMKNETKEFFYARKELTLLDILRPDFIQLKIKVKSWEEAFYVAAAPLIEAEIIHSRYIDTIIQTTRKEGPYMMIADKTALPHARPEDGAKKVGLGITVLDDEVSVLGKTAIKYIFTFSAVDNKKHLTAIAELVALLEQPAFFECLNKSQSSQEVFDWLKQDPRVFVSG